MGLFVAATEFSPSPPPFLFKKIIIIENTPQLKPPVSINFHFHRMLCLRGKEGNSRELAKTIRVNVLFEKCGASRTLAFSFRGQSGCWDGDLGTAGRGRGAGLACALPRRGFGRPRSMCSGCGNCHMVFAVGCRSLRGGTCAPSQLNKGCFQLCGGCKENDVP